MSQKMRRRVPDKTPEMRRDFYEGSREPWKSLDQVRRQHALIRKFERRLAG